MSRRGLAALLGAAVMLVAAPAGAHAATLSVVPDGHDEGNCVAEPCATWRYAYEQASEGDVIEVRAGVFGAQVVPVGLKPVTFRGLPGNKVRKLDNSASNVTFDGIDVDAGFTTPAGAAFENHPEPGGVNVTFKNGRIGNVADEKGALLGGWPKTDQLNFVFDNVEFHDVIQRTDGVHNECVFSQAPGLTIRNSTFRNCATMDLFLVRGDWWGQPMYGGVTLENNVFGHPVNGSGWHSYAVYFSIGKFENIRVVNNTFESAVILDNLGLGPYTGVWANNVGGGWECLPGVTYRTNVGTRCDGSDKPLTPEFSCAPPACPLKKTLPVGWVNPAQDDFHLVEASPARGVADPAYAPLLDRDGKVRGDRPDAGAYQREGTLDAPVCAPLEMGDVPKATPTVNNVLCAGRDVSYAITVPPAHGTATIDAAGAVTYTGAEGYVGEDRFTVRAADRSGRTATAEVTLQIANHAPVCTPLDLGTVARGMTVSSVMDCTDLDGDKLTYSVATAPKTGTALVVSRDRALFYTAASDAAGRDDFMYTAHDGTVAAEPVDVKVEVGNSKPVCPAAEQRIRAGKPWPMILQCEDADGDPLQYTITSGPEHGTAKLEQDDFGASLVYSPLAAFVGSDRVTVRASDGIDAVQAEFAFDVTANHAPVCKVSTIHTRVDEPRSTWVDCTDEDVQDANELRFEAVSSPTHGIVGGLPGGPAPEINVTYFPATGFTGADAFTIRATDGELAGTAEQRVHVADTPYCDALGTLALAAGARATVTLSCTQPDDVQDPLVFKVVKAPAKGTLTGSGPSFEYTAGAAGGADSFAVTATGEAGESPPVTQAVAIAGGAPTCAPQAVTVAQDASVDIPLSCVDPAGGDPALSIVAGPPAQHGTLGAIDQAAHTVRFTPSAAYTGETSFTFRGGDSEPALVNITVTRANQAPQATLAGVGTPRRGVEYEYTAVYHDPDGDETIVEAAWDTDDDGFFDDATGASARVTFTKLGATVVRFRVTDTGGKSMVKSLDVEVVNLAPTASITGADTTQRGVAVELTGAASDADGNGTITTREWDVDGDGFDDGQGATKTVTFTTLGTKTVRFRVVDDGGLAIIASKTIDVLNRAPAASITGPSAGNRGQSLTFTGHPSDLDGDATIAKLEWDTDGDGFDDGQGASLTAAFATSGAKTIRLRVTDDAGETVTATWSATIANRGPAAAIAGPATAARGVAIDLAGSASDPDGDGTIAARAWDVDGDGFDDGEGAANTVTFTTLGTKTVRFRVTDDDGATAVASHEVTVTNRAPSGSIAGPPTAARGVEVQFTGSGTDPDGTIAGLAWDTDGDGFDDGTGTTLKTTFASLGTKTVRLRVTDGDDGTFVAQTTLEIVNRQPAVTLTGPPSAFAGDAVDLAATASDPDGTATIAAIGWDTDGDGFDDGAGATLRTSFAAPGAKTVRVQVTDDAGAVAIASHSLDVAQRVTTTPPADRLPDTIAPPLEPTPAPPATLSASAPKQKLAAAAKGLKLTVTSNRGGAVTFAVTVDKATAKRLGLGSTTTLLKLTKPIPAGRTTVKLKFNFKVAKALSRAKKPVKLKLGLTGTGAPGAALQLTLAR